MAALHPSRRGFFVVASLLSFILILSGGLFYHGHTYTLSAVDTKGSQPQPAGLEQSDTEKPTTSFIFHPTKPSQVKSFPIDSPGSGDWTFEAKDHADDYGLGDTQCDAAFPDMYFEIDRAASFWKSRRNITLTDVDISWKENGLVRAMIYDRQLFIIEPKYNGDGYDLRRSLAILSSIYRALVTYHGPLPNIEFSFSVSDVPDPDHFGKPIWTSCRRTDAEEEWLMPDFGFWSWDIGLIGSYEHVRQEIAAVETDFRQKRPLAVWRGAKNNDLRADLLRVATGRTWSDVQEIIWAGKTFFRTKSRGQFIKMAEHCKYKYLIQTEGASYSGRGKYLQNCNSVVIMHKRQWIENHHHLLITDSEQQNVVEVERDFSDLPLKMDYLLTHPLEAKRIANNSVMMFRDRYLTPAAQACYWRRLFRIWRDISFEPELYDDIETEDSVTGELRIEKKLRGVPYQTYM
ncbi:MAG: hypothetical protein M1821_000211 [Bathelium mastoideum]|nr:MAG: hypothetical protein M1821_000211 [Bathelium mastoideum]